MSSANWFAKDSVSFEGLQAQARTGLEDIANKFNEMSGAQLIVTSGTDSQDIHKAGKRSHGAGVKLDVAADWLENVANREQYITYLESLGIHVLDEYSSPSANSTGGHLDLDFTDYAIGTPGFGDFIESAYNNTHPATPIVEQEEPQEASFIDKFQDSLYDSVVWGAFRTAATKKDLPDEPDFKLTQEDIDRVQKELGDYTATLWVCQNANSSAQLNRLIQMKKEDLERRKRVEESEIGLSTAGTILGAFLDPINYLPVLGATGKLGSVARYARLAAGAATGNLVERGMAQAAAGYQQDYPMAALMGAVAGAGIPMALDMLGKGSAKTRAVGEQLYGEATNTVIDAERLAKGERLSTESINTKEFVDALTKAHDKKYVKSIKDAGVGGQIRPKHGVYVVSKEDAKKIVEARGWEFNENAKGFFDDESGITVLVKDNLSGSEDIRKVLLHERGAHGLKYVLSENDYAKVMADLKFRINNNPSPAIERAVKRAGGNADVEEVLGYLAEELKPSNPLMRNIHKAMNKGLNALGVKGRLSDDDFIDILTKGAKHYAEGQKGYRVLGDGSCVYKGIHYSTKNLFNPEKLTMAARFENLKDGAKENLETLLKRTALYATPYSVCSTSASKTLKDLASKLVANPYMEKLGGLTSQIPAEVYKDNMRFQAEHIFNAYMKIRNKSLVKLQKFSADAMYDYNEAAIRFYNAKHAGNTAGMVGQKVSPEVAEGIAALEEFRKFMEGLLTDPAKYIGEGYGLLSHDWHNFDDEFYRIIDTNKHAKLAASYDDPLKFRDDMYKYCLTNGKKDVVREQIEAERMIESRKSNLKKGKGQEMDLPKPLTDEEFQQEYEKRAWACALGWVDMSASKLDKTSNFAMTQIGSLDCVKYRFPVDTSAEMKLSNGNMFSYDNNLRSYNLDSYINPLINRIAGEVSLTTVFPKDTKTIRPNPLGFVEQVDYNLSGMRSVIEAELEEKVRARQITKDQKANDLKAFEFMCDKLRSMPVAENPHSLMDAAARTLNSYAYARNSGNMVFNQMGEISGTLAYAGYNAIFDMFPGLGKMVTEARMGRGSVDMLEDARLATFGDEGYKYIFGNAGDISSSVYRDILGETRTAAALDKVAGFANLSSNAMSKLTGFQKLTETMIQSAQKQTLIDVAKWVNGKDFAAYRNPFSNKKMAAIGLNSDEAIKRFREDLKDYVVLDKDGNLVDFNVKALRQNEPDLYMRYYMMMENQVKRCITMPSIGSTNMLKESNPFWRVFFMFKDFTMRATHTQFLRLKSNHEADDILSAAFSVATNMAVVIGLAYAHSKFDYHTDNEYKHQKYMNEYFKPESLAYIALMRNSTIGAALSPVNDLLEATNNTPLPSIRTTTNRYKRNKSNNEMVGDYLMQLPAVKTGTDFISSASDLTKIPRGEYTKKEFKELLNLIPGQNFVGFMNLRDEIFGLPKDN